MPVAKAQNFVENGTFEAHDSCPYSLDQVEFCTGWYPIRHSPDYYNCGFNNGNNFQFPNNGSGFVCMLGGLLSDTAVYYYSELIKSKLKFPLIAGKRYLIKFSVGLNVFTQPHNQNDFGLYFYDSNSPLSFSYYSKGCINERPQISISPMDLFQNDYVDFSFCFTPTQNYDSVLVGPFCNSNSFTGPIIMNYYLFDDFEITEFQETDFVGTPQIICDSGYVNFSATNWTQPTHVDWQFDGGSPSSSIDLYPQPVFYNQPGNYDVTFVMDDVCNDTIIKKDYIKVMSRLTDVLTDEIITKCDETEIEIKATNGIEGLWSTGVTAESIKVKQPGKYYFTQTNQCDTLIDSVLVKNEICPCGFFIPNSFSPNNDLINDTFMVYGDGEKLELIIYNRWGKKVFSTDNKYFSWNGYYNNQKVMQGVYYFVANYKDCKGDYKSTSGSLTILY